MDPKKERERKQWWIDKLNTISSGWIDGDVESRVGKTADIVNKGRKIAIELKLEDRDPLRDEISNIAGLSNMFQRDFKSANNKFKNYAGYLDSLND